MLHLIRRTCAALLLLVILCGACLAQSNQKTKQADDLYAAQKWVEAAAEYEMVVKEDPNNAFAWYQLGMSQLALHKYEPAIQALEKNISLKQNPVAMYNVACAYARLGQKEKAVDWLTRAAAKLPPYINIAGDEDLASLREDPRFKEIARDREKKRRPCLYSPAARQFDFWVGEWNVFNPQGQQAGTSVIQQVAEGCGILENWTDRFGTTGKSINFYDPQAQKWNQYWIGANGVPNRYSGTYRDGAMRFEGEPATA